MKNKLILEEIAFVHSIKKKFGKPVIYLRETEVIA